MEETKLSSSVSIKEYRNYKAQKNTPRIADLILERFRERYIIPFENNRCKHGFSMIAIGCLMVEALYSFKNGWKRTGVKGGEAFEDFFSSSKYLTVFKGQGEEFYSKIRCGVLHQAETYDGWTIVRSGELLDRINKTINATKFLKAIDLELHGYTTLLRSASYDSDIWKKAIRKLDYICSNCNE